ncbi:MAG: ribose-phosphate pyrophosphokinase [Clostridia bacterium]|nr:ribose-phosphate pyrophosphokinase [Clostridia bacterium]
MILSNKSLHGTEIKIFSCNSNMKLAQDICDILEQPMGRSEVTKFSDGEISVSLKESVRGKDCFVIQSTSDPVNDNLMEMLIMIDALKRASASRITAVIPYMGYARQDRKAKARDPISAKLCADLITTAGADRVLTMDLHAAQIQGFFNIPVDHLLGAPILAKYFKEKMGENNSEYMCVSPDLGSVTRVRNFAQRLDCPIAIIDKRRQKANVSEVMNIIGDVNGKKILLIDDMVDTAGTICNAAEALIKNGALEVSACATHAVLSGPALKRIDESPIKEFVFLDTIHLGKEKMLDKFTILSTAPYFADTIRRVYSDEPISIIFD